MAPTYTVVCEELYAVRQHLYDLLRPLSLEEMLRSPGPGSDCISAHLAHIAVAEAAATGSLTRKAASETTLSAALERYTETRNPADLPGPGEILEAARRVRDNTIAYLALPFRAVRDEAQAAALAEPFRRVINNEYQQAAQIAAICRSFGKPEAEPPPSARVDTSGPPYVLSNWNTRVTPPITARL